MSTPKVYFRGKIRKIICGYPLLSGAMEYHNTFPPGEIKKKIYLDTIRHKKLY